MELSGKFFDGKTSKPHPIHIEVDDKEIIIFSSDTNLPITSKNWDLDACQVESLNASDNVLIKSMKYEGERLEFRGKDARQLVALINFNEDILSKSYHTVLTDNPLRVVVSAFVVLGIVGYFYLAHFSPFIADRIVAIIPSSLEVKLGEASMNQITSFYDVDEEKSKIIQEFYNECGFTSEYPIEIKVIDDELVNAFAAPGGQIVVFQGIIDKTESWESLAGLIAHEKAHVENRHSVKVLARNASSFLIFSALTGDIAGASGILLENAYKLNELSNSRDHEREADSEGLRYLKDLKIKPEGMSELFELLLEEQGMDLDESMEILSTHPLSQNRIKDIEALIESDDAFDYEPVVNDKANELWLQLKTSDNNDNDSEADELTEDESNG